MAGSDKEAVLLEINNLAIVIGKIKGGWKQY